MNDSALSTFIQQHINSLAYARTYVSSSSPASYKWSNLRQLRATIDALSEIEFLLPEVTHLQQNAIFNTTSDELKISSDDDTKITIQIDKLRNGLEYILRALLAKNKYTKQDSVIIKLPETKTFDELSKVATDFKKGVEIPILDSAVGEVNIMTAESGSIWLLVYVGSAINLVAAICWSAAVLRRKFAEAKLFEQHARTLTLKNDSLENLIDSQKQQLQNILQAEAESIANKHYTEHNNENVERLKLSISTISELIEKGAMILPAEKSNPDTNKLFPDYNHLSLIESTIKQLKNSA